MASVVRSTALRAGGACVRCRKGKTKCVYENGRAPCKNCAKGMHECYLPSESMSHGGHGVSPARVQQRARESLPTERAVASASGDRQAPPASGVSRHVSTTTEKLTPELMQECERVISKTLPACVAFHKPSFIQQLKNTAMDPTMVNALLTTAARHSPAMIRRYGGHGGGGSTAAEHFAGKTISLIMQALDQPSLADIQALCLLVIHEWGCRNAVRAYIYLGQAARMAQMYRVVHTHHHQPDPDQFLQDESFRRTLWLIYILDCFLTSSPGRHPALSSHDVKGVSLPCLDMNYHFGSPVYVQTLDKTAPSIMTDPAGALGDVGEFGHIVLATKAWRNVVEMMTTTTLETFSEEQCQSLEHEIDNIRHSLPVHFADKPGQINLHITMGSGYTYAMIHSLLNCGTIFVNRRRILQVVTDENFSLDAWRMSSHAHVQAVDRIFAASHSIIHSLLSLEHGADKDSILCFPIFMLFSAFTAGSTVAYLTLKGLAPSDVTESASGIVRDSLRLCQDGSESWPLVVPWQRHLSVMSKVLREVNTTPRDLRDSREDSKPNHHVSPSVKDDILSQADTNPDAMDYDQAAGPGPQSVHSSGVEGRGSEPPIPRRPGITTINGGSAGASTPATASPPPPAIMPKADSPGAASSASVGPVPQAPPAAPDVDMTALELCAAFERQLLELDDLAAFMGGGV
ncbi:Nitrogen assimilation transcription factor nit-4 [Madurella mycetomatis]|uniref:Nitrogen assimilation transcription factor nit-4 n=1 Tax=Madurella mycetomatis TaxID=100816 RepID=A0A175W7D7_9PEZI|nr:Nitrogen assimilation transcription factor nit-4 [Madurella mycetomatis]